MGFEEGGAGGVERRGLYVFVEVWGGNGADPVVTRLESFSRAGVGWYGGWGWCADCSCRLWLWDRAWVWLRFSGGGAGLALRVMVVDLHAASAESA